MTFTRTTGLTTHGVYMTAVKGQSITPKLVYRSDDPAKELAVESALNSGLLSRITEAILGAGV